LDRKSLKAEFPAFEEKYFAPLRDAAVVLFDWRTSRVGNADAASGAGGNGRSSSSAGASMAEIMVEREWNASDWDHHFQVVEADDTAAFLDEVQDFASLEPIDDDDDIDGSAGPDGDVIANVDWSQAAMEPLDTEWLRNQCARFAAGSGSPMHATELASSITTYLLSSKTDLELQEQLFNFLGYASVEFVELLLKNRMRLVALSTSRPGAAPGGSNVTAPSSSFIIQTKQDKLLEKLQRKEMQKLRSYRTV
jgi:hypothetical protein